MSAISYETLKAELDQVLADIQSDDISIDDALAAYKKGIELVHALEKHLKEAENKIQKLQKSS